MIVRTERKGDGMAITHLIKVGDIMNDCERRRNDRNRQYTDDRERQMIARLPTELFMSLAQRFPEEVQDDRKFLRLIETLPECAPFRTTTTSLT